MNKMLHTSLPAAGIQAKAGENLFSCHTYNFYPYLVSSII
ncbi:hypothetical protein BRYFOR_06236 [Marvinbryantia formatexigens DSM 14469]|uniref:Uncharacterized protein n=1 Tax=Marvinbryantia formatexigens DSM 14469 TaxID=478749 RepID=C6LC89_9FIRM|nr:hypothetical protein BRYFOR_06236 [Marvinbryantia formatexigens DSM 14469]